MESGAQTIVGVNADRTEETPGERRPLGKPDPALMQAHLAAFAQWKAQRSAASLDRALGELARTAQGDGNVFGAVVESAAAGATHGEICATLRRELGFGQPLIVV